MLTADRIHTFIHKWNETYLPSFCPLAERHRILAVTQFPTHWG